MWSSRSFGRLRTDLVPEEFPDGTDVVAGFKQMRGR